MSKRGNVAPSSCRPPAEWQAIRIAYETTRESIASLCARYHLSARTLYERAKKEAWAPRHQPARLDRAGIIGRMFRLLDRQILHLEHNMTATGEKLASTLEKLIDIEAATDTPAAGPTRRKDMTDLRDKLAERIEQLKRA
jgi:hypothetical protein